MHLFFIENTQWVDSSASKILLQEEEARHAIKVLRLRVGDEVYATDGEGNWYQCAIEEVNKKNCLLTITQHWANYGKRNYKIHIAVAPTKNTKRFEWFLEKATEMGIDEITPIISRYSERKELKIERSLKVITAAMKQSLKAYHPKLNEAIKLKQFLTKELPGEKYIAHLIDENQVGLKELYSPSQDVCILIGPEGDFSDEEIEMAQKKGFIAVKMGTQRLRTETAAMVACNYIHFANDF